MSILYLITVKPLILHLTVILICGRFPKEIVSRNVFDKLFGKYNRKHIFIRFICLCLWNLGCLLCNLVGLTSKMMVLANTLESVIPRFGQCSWATHSLPIVVSLMAYIIKSTETNMICLNLITNEYFQTDWHQLPLYHYRIIWYLWYVALVIIVSHA